MNNKVNIFTVISLTCAVFMSGCATTSVKQVGSLSVRKKDILEKYTGPKRKVAVVDFVNKTRYGTRLGDVASDILVTELGKTGKFILIEREKLKKILEEQSLALSGAVDSNTASKVGRLAGVSAIITGSVSQFGVKTTSSDYLLTSGKKQTAESTVDVRVIDVETGEIIYTDSGKGIAAKKTSAVLGLGKSGGYDETIEGEALRAAIVKFVINIVERINEKPWNCKVADVDGSDIYIDAGRESGLRTGSLLTVYKLGKKITSPTTGTVIGRKKEKLAEIKIKEYFGNNGSIAELISGQTPSSGDICIIQ